MLWCPGVLVLVEFFFTWTFIKLPLILGWILKAGLGGTAAHIKCNPIVPTERPFGPLLEIHSRREDATAPPVRAANRIIPDMQPGGRHG